MMMPFSLSGEILERGESWREDMIKDRRGREGGRGEREEGRDRRGERREEEGGNT